MGQVAMAAKVFFAAIPACFIALRNPSQGASTSGLITAPALVSST